MGLDFRLLVSLAARSVRDLPERRLVGRELAHLSQEEIQHLKEIAVDIDISPHVRLSQRQGGTRHQSFFIQFASDLHGEFRRSAADFLDFAVRLDLKRHRNNVLKIIFYECIHFHPLIP